MEARRQYYDPVRNSRAEELYFPLDPELPTAAVLSHPSEDVHMEPHAPVGDPQGLDAQQFLLLYPPDTPLVDPSQSHVDEDESMAPKIEFSTQWNNRREAVWDVLGPKRGTQTSLSALAPEARAPPKIWAENIYDAQDVLPYFTVGQTILASKIPRAVSRSVLLTRNLRDIHADWRAGKIGFTMYDI
ncbi:unnamed protein product [Rhizoctonia solani]|uniref:Uncharacterized protein n=1 Tax=Rhizoctonia solani TaxID=456999 RepID=A0A8H3C6W8_9AGAM|nr:unnamed protein product [Rhizoctonia solani]